MDAETQASRTAVLSHYSDTGIRCKCCHTDTVEFLNLVPVRLNEAGVQVFRRQDAPTPESRWSAFERKGFPDSYVVYCSNCVAAHQLGDCPYAVESPSE